MEPGQSWVWVQVTGICISSNLGMKQRGQDTEIQETPMKISVLTKEMRSGNLP